MTITEHYKTKNFLDIVSYFAFYIVYNQDDQIRGS